MKNKTNTNTHSTITTKTPVQAQCIKLGIDVHADSYRVVRQLDNATPQPAQKFTPKAFLLWARRQLELAGKVYTCYEAGPFGYGLHRALEALGIQNVVVRPQNWDELGKGVKTDQTDALALVQRLEAQGRSLLLYHGQRVRGPWWSARNWPLTQPLLAAPLQELLQTLRDLILSVTEKLDQATDRLAAQAAPAPYGFGALSTQLLQNEVGD